MIRLDKYLADMGVGTRSQVKQFIKKGQIQINGEIQKRPETKLDIAKDKVSFQGEEISYPSIINYYYLFNNSTIETITFLLIPCPT